MSALHLSPASVIAFAAAHDAAADRLPTGPGIAAHVERAVGPAGASFAAALATFETAIARTSADLADSHRQMGTALRRTTNVLTATDDANAERLNTPAPAH